MTNPRVFNYLRDGISRGFNEGLLKQKLLQSGYKQIDIDEALNEIHKVNYSSPARPNIFSNMKPQQGYFNQPNKSDGVKWMKIAGVIGIILSVIFIAFMLTLVFLSSNTDSFQQQIPSPQPNNLIQQSSAIPGWILMAVISVLLILWLIYYKGFVEMGNKTQSKLLTISAKSIIVLTIISILLSVGGIIYINYYLSSAFSQNSIISAEPPANVANIFSFIKIGLIAGGSIFVINIALIFMFSIALIKANGKIKFTLPSGVFYLISSLYYTAFLIFIIFSLFSLFSALSSLSINSPMGGDTGPNQIILGMAAFFTNKIVAIAFLVVSFLALLLGSLSLLDGSKKFESINH
ncbi:MAG: hypothetical protein US31_C0015G0012 [Berkelbacteria bacterium GW2011_GWA1_36_9]|uniref:Uncharacterized protein n=1 Tax=Berkelbacteria bacterium GW2011_GWA1_36_9 TaxID=1618331 RepID=A0A0G0IP96_9BACT|nr:MAG: hypothetical protein US31_C0015G0012 [Berkelbacteria bacterium GW2011_GWA1_36_9]